ncbi:MAG: hypothetical protein MHM6MM_004733 [Cercozoa sp. M6MM]
MLLGLFLSALALTVLGREYMFWHQKPEFLVFEGGGNRAFAYCGTLYELGRHGYLDKVRGAAGASAGSVFATMVAAGFSTTEITEAMLRTDFSQFAGDTWWPTKVWNLFEKFGLIRGDEVVDWIGALLEAKGIAKDTTFKQLHELTQRELVIVGSDVSVQRPVYFTRDSFPDMQVRHAVRASMSIPVLYEPVHIEVPPGLLPDLEQNTTERHMFVDGNLWCLQQLPITCVRPTMSQLNFLPVWRQTPSVEAAATLGFKMIDNSEQFDPVRLEISEKEPDSPDSLGSYLVKLLTSLQNVLGDWQSTPDAHLFWRRTILVNSGDFGTVNYDFTVEQKIALFKLGLQSAYDAMPPSETKLAPEEVERMFERFQEENAATIKSAEEAEKNGCAEDVDGVRALCSALEHIGRIVNLPDAPGLAHCGDIEEDEDAAMHQEL